MMKGDDERCLKLGLTIFGALAASIAFFFLLDRAGMIKKFLSTIISALQPVIYGMATAYVLFPLERRLERLFKKFGRFSRAASVFSTVLLAFVIVVLFFAMVLPQLVSTVGELVSTLPGLLNTQLDKLRVYLEHDSEAGKAVMQMLESLGNSLLNWVKTDMFGVVSSLSGRVLSIGSAIVNLVIAVVISIYLLFDRERYVAQCRKLFLSVSTNKRFNKIVGEAVAQTDHIFSGFISGKLVDSLIVGIISFVALTLLRIPYALLVSVIVGVTNIIPMFGAFLGAVLGGFLILLVSPVKCVVFVIVNIILQQIDGNIIGPRILGNSTGLSALYVTVAMLLFGKLLGFLGMIIGVPLFATLYYCVKRAAEYSLRRQNMPTQTAAYISVKEKDM